MAAALGDLTLLLALVLASYSAIGSLLGARRSSPELLDSARYASYMTTLVMLVATLTLVAAFLSHDFQIRYVQQHSNLAMPRIYTWVAFYAGNEGSLLFLALVLSGLSSLAIRLAPGHVRPSLPYTNAILMLFLVFFLAVMISLANPFAELPFAPQDGQGVNPLLVHPGMFAHPPMLMTGLIGVVIPFSFAMGALLAGRTGDEWVDAGRMWGILSWAILGSGLLLGSWWAYTVLGWGGYWGWDPVENAGLMPFLALTAFIHSIMVQKRRGMFRMWNIALIIIAFGLAQFGMFINRGGPVPSVHSFAASTLGWVFLSFMVVTIGASLLLFLLRARSLRSAQPLDSALSREAAFLVNNLLLLAVASVTLWGVVFPLISEITQGRSVTVAAPFYNQVNGPLLMALIFLMAVGPLLPWRRASISSVQRAVMFPGIVALAVVGILFLAGVRNAYVMAAFGICGMVATGVFREWSRGTLSRHRKGESYTIAFARLITANRPRYGGYMVHMAVVALALGVAGSSVYGVQRDVVLAQDEEASLSGYTIKYLGHTESMKVDRAESRANVALYRGDELLGVLDPWRAYYPDFNMASTRPAIRSTPVEDFYLIYTEDLEDGSALFRIHVNPLVMWIWVAGPILILGTVVSLWPQRQRRLTPGGVSEGASPSYPVGAGR